MSEAILSSVNSLIEKKLSRKGEYFTLGRVIKSDAINNLVWLEEFGQNPIPLVGFDYSVTYYDTTQTGEVVKKVAKVKIQCPKKGQQVLVARELGARHLPRCLGVIQSKNFVLPVSD